MGVERVSGSGAPGAVLLFPRRRGALSDAAVRPSVRLSHLGQLGAATRAVRTADPSAHGRRSASIGAIYLSKVADFDPPHLHLAPSQGLTPVEFRGDLWFRKLESLGYRVVLCDPTFSRFSRTLDL